VLEALEGANLDEEIPLDVPIGDFESLPPELQERLKDGIAESPKQDPLAEFERQRGPKFADEGYTEPPVAFNENDVPADKRLWVTDYHDQILPRRKGFITDYVYHTRGVMVPTLAAVWSAVYVMQAAIKREAWLKWYPKRHYLNQYIIIIGPAGLAKKTTAVTEFGLPMLEGFRDYIRDRNIYEMKHVEIVKDKTTPEALLTAMLPESRPGVDWYITDENGEHVLDEEGRAIAVTRTSETALVVSELVTMLGSSSYTRSMTEILLDLYDPKESWDWRTEKRGVKKIKKSFLSLIAGTTVDGFRDSVPNAAKGDGFLSRTVLCYVPRSKRKYPMSFEPWGSPTGTEMQRRLAWIAERTLGEFEFTPEATALYVRWWETYYKRMEDFPEMAGATSRMDANVRKLSVLMRANRYDAEGPQVDVEDVLDAIRLIEATYSSLPFLMGQLNEDLVLRITDKLSEYLSKKGLTSRAALLSAVRIRSDYVTLALNELVGRGLIAAVNDGVDGVIITGKTSESYRWIGGDNDGTRKAEELWSAASYFDIGSVPLLAGSIPSARSKPHSPTPLPSGRTSGPSKRPVGRPKGSKRKRS
jgi:hypothetical protein